MTDNISQELIDILYKYSVIVMQKCNPHTTKQTVSWKVLQFCADSLKIDLNRCIDKKLIYLHPENVERIDSKWNSFKENKIKLLHDDITTYERIKSADYINLLDIQKFITIMLNKDQIKSETNEKLLRDNFLYELLAMDGFHGYSFNDMKNYIDNLRIGKESDHVQAVREIYKTFDISADTMHLALLNIYAKFTRDDEMKQILKNVKRDLESKISDDKLKNLDNIINAYEDRMNSKHLETIAIMKLAQLMNRTKKMKTIIHKNAKKRGRKTNIIKQNHEESVSKKPKVQIISSDEEDNEMED